MKVLITVLLALAMVGCAVNSPVTSASVVDDRPRISFKVEGFDADELLLFIDNVSYGSLENYLSENDSGSENALRILPGQHKVEVRMGRIIIFEKTTYFAEGLQSIFKVAPR